MKPTLAAITATCYVASVVLANVLTERLGLVPIGFGLVVTAGTFAAGATLLARNIAQDVIGSTRLRRYAAVLTLMLTGCALSWWLASPQLAVASCAAFALSESADMAVFTPLRDSGWSRAAASAALVSSTVDTLVFLHIAGFPITPHSVTGQLVVKVGISWAVAAGVALSGARLHPLKQVRGHRQGVVGQPLTAEVPVDLTADLGCVLDRLGVADHGQGVEITRHGLEGASSYTGVKPNRSADE